MTTQQAIGLRTAADVVDTVAEVPARYVVAPESTEEVAAVLRYASEHGLTVVPRGTATKLEWGRPPERVDVILDTSRLVGVVEHAAGDLVVRVRAGTPMSGLGSTLLPTRQRLALMTRLSAQSGPLGGTVGGTIAANPSSALRYRYGMVRDLLIGVTMVRADGTIAHAGGKVVKNVAGYDLGKLLCGSLGTLGVVTEAVFRLHPEPEASRLVSVEVESGAAAQTRATAVRHSHLDAVAVEIDAARTGSVTLAVLVEGVAGGVPARADAVGDLLGDDAAMKRIEVPSDFPAWWFRPSVDAAGTALRIAVAASGAGEIVDVVRAYAVQHDLQVRIRGSFGTGVVHVGLGGAYDPEPVADLVDRLRPHAGELGGTVLVEHAPGAVHAELARRGTDAFGPIPALDVMRRIKAQFDPGRVLAPGRFAGGI